nr:hypothetical protein [uncultured Rhodopila sp.]
MLEHGPYRLAEGNNGALKPGFATEEISVCSTTPALMGPNHAKVCRSRKQLLKPSTLYREMYNSIHLRRRNESRLPGQTVAATTQKKPHFPRFAKVAWRHIPG